jgi:DNA-binding transcriptional regulator YdaS (Cro superfamily)
MDAVELIDALGGTTAVAELFGLRPPSVSGWKEAGRIPDDKLIRLAPIAEARGIVTRKALFPNDWQDIWPELCRRKAA